MFAILLFAFSLILFVARLVGFEKEVEGGGYRWAIIDFLSALFFFIGFYFLSFPTTSSLVVNQTIVNQSFIYQANAIQTNLEENVPVFTNGWYLLLVLTIFYIGLMVIWALA